MLSVTNHIGVVDRCASLKYLLCNGAVDVRNDDLVIPVPQVDSAITAACALVLGGYAEGDIIGPLL